MNHLRRRGYQPGLGLVDPNDRYFLLSIPKNASTFLGNTLTANGWRFDHIENCARHEQLIVLRDPVSRWLSGFATYVSLQLLGYGYGSDHFVEEYNPLVERLIFDNLVFDDHTTPQVEYINQLPKGNYRTYFWCKQDLLVSGLSKYTNYNIIVPNSVEDNDREDNYDTKHLYEFMSDRLDKVVTVGRDLNGAPEQMSLLDRIRRIYDSDYKLIKEVKIYGT